MLGIDLKEMWKNKALETLIDFWCELDLQAIDMSNMSDDEIEILIEEANKRLDIEFEKMMNNPIICKDIDIHNNFIRQKNFLSQKSYNPKKKKK